MSNDFYNTKLQYMLYARAVQNSGVVASGPGEDVRAVMCCRDCEISDEHRKLRSSRRMVDDARVLTLESSNIVMMESEFTLFQLRRRRRESQHDWLN